MGRCHARPFTAGAAATRWFRQPRARASQAAGPGCAGPSGGRTANACRTGRQKHEPAKRADPRRRNRPRPIRVHHLLFAFICVKTCLLARLLASPPPAPSQPSEASMVRVRSINPMQSGDGPAAHTAPSGPARCRPGPRHSPRNTNGNINPMQSGDGADRGPTDRPCARTNPGARQSHAARRGLGHRETRPS